MQALLRLNCFGVQQAKASVTNKHDSKIESGSCKQSNNVCWGAQQKLEQGPTDSSPNSKSRD